MGASSTSSSLSPGVLTATVLALTMFPAGAALPWAAGSWELVDKLDPASAEAVLDPEAEGSYPFTAFGSKVALDGDRLVVSTTFDSCDAPSWVYVFKRTSNGAWQPETKLYPNDGEWADPDDGCNGFGSAIDLDEENDVVVVGNPSLSVPGEKQAGGVYVFERNHEGWSQAAKFIGPVNGEEGEWPGEDNITHGPGLGFSVAVDDGVVVAGAPHAVLEHRSQGMAEVYERTAEGEWTRAARVTTDSPEEADHFAFSVDVSAGSVLAGATTSDEAFVFENKSGSWEIQGKLEPPGLPGEQLQRVNSFGFSVAISDDVAVVGAPSGPDIHGQPATSSSLSRGEAVVYTRSSNTWTLGQVLTPADGLPDTMFGKDVAVDEGAIVVGAPHWPEFVSSFGAAYIYDGHDHLWKPSAKLASNETSQWDEFGASVAISEDTVLIGSPFDDNRQDGTPYPLNDEGDIPPAACNHLGCSGVDEGEDAGSAFLFEPLATGGEIS